MKPLGELKRLYVGEGRPLPRAVERALRDDPRSGAQGVLAAVARRRRKNRAEGQRLRKMLRYERRLWDEGQTHVAGVDEAGMSPLAGPVCAAAVILPVGWRLPRVDDSKKLKPEERDELVVVIKETALAWSVGWATPEEIDEINIYHAGLLAMRRAVEGLAPTPESLLVDARKIPDPPCRQRAIVGGDGKSLSIAAASIVAKTTRDALMVELDRTYPGYGLAQHKGYPVPKHRAAIRRLGLSPIHRRSFPAVYRALNGQTD